MGYTHYWDMKQDEETMEAFKDAMPVIATILDEHADILANANGTECTKPEFSYGEDEALPILSFNGIKENMGEDFTILFSRNMFKFCKTNRMPYDLVVCKVLLACLWYIPGFKIRSDGFLGDLYREGERMSLDENWDEAIEYMERTFGMEFWVVPDPDYPPGPGCRGQSYILIVSERKPEFEMEEDPLGLEEMGL